MELEIKPCPKCGNQKVSVRGIFRESDGKGCDRVKCKQCGFTGPFAETAEEAVKVWNILIVEVFEKMNPHHEKEGDAMKKHEPCPACGEANVEVKQMTLSKEEIIRGERKFRAVCRKCGWSGPAYDNQNDALLRWDDIAKQIRRHADSKRTPENADVVKHIDAVLMMNAEKKRAEKKNATRKEILDAAAACVCKERNDQYGEPEDCFRDIANLWAAYKGVDFDPFDVAMMMSLLKVARAKANPQHTDNYVDLCGYGSIAGELANKEENK